MYTLLIIQPPTGLDEYHAHGLMQQFAGSPAAAKARAGALAGCRALNNFAFELSGDYVRALVELQRGADEANVATSLLTFSEAPTIAAAPPLRPISG